MSYSPKERLIASVQPKQPKNQSRGSRSSTSRDAVKSSTVSKHFSVNPCYADIQSETTESSSTSSSPKRSVDEMMFSPAQYRLEDASSSACVSDGKSDGSSSALNQSSELSVEDDYDSYQFIAGLPPYNSLMVQWKSFLPLNGICRPTLALDLDETLVHSSLDPVENPDLVFCVNFGDDVYDVYVRLRPYLDYFLETVSQHFEVVIFTASQRVYADALLNLLDPQTKYFSHRLFRDSCILVQGNYVKDLNVLGRDLRRTVLVDNSPHAFGYHIDNGIPIESWFDDPWDSELLKLVGTLRHIFIAKDVRTFIRERYKLHELVAAKYAKLDSSSLV